MFLAMLFEMLLLPIGKIWLLKLELLYRWVDRAEDGGEGGINPSASFGIL